jgi:AcrR family transcriptional regulator
VERRVKDIRTSILTSAEQEFLEKGYEGTSIDGIVREVGGSKSTVYAHFGDKKQLFTETVARIRNDFDFALTRARAGAPAAPREGLVVLGVELLSILYHTRIIHLFRTVMAEAHRFPEVARQLAVGATNETPSHPDV